MKKRDSPCPFGAVLVQARKSRGITQYRLAKLTERSVQQISKIERGEREPLISTVIMLATALGMNPGDLVRETAELMPSCLSKS